MWRSDSRALRVLVGVATARGPRYAVNEDRSVTAGGVFGIADGMGGPGGGDIAAEIAASEVIAAVTSGASGLEAATAAHSAVRARRSHGATARMGTTLCIGVVGWNDQTPAVQVANVGDSRAYVASTGTDWRQVTHDQSLVQDLVDQGLISDEEARIHPRRNVVLSAVGHDVFEPEVAILAAVPNMRLVFCSDGVTDVVADDELGTLCSARRAPRTAAAEVVERVAAVGGRDDATILVAEVVALPRRLPNLSQ